MYNHFPLLSPQHTHTHYYIRNVELFPVASNTLSYLVLKKKTVTFLSRRKKKRGGEQEDENKEEEEEEKEK